MLHIILLILKIIGIILLCILGILLFTVCCVLLVPLRYRVEIFREEGEGKPPVNVRVKITWLLHLINVLLCYPSDVYVRERIFLFPVFRMPEKEKKEGRKKEKDGRTQTDRKEPADGTEDSPNGGKDGHADSVGGVRTTEETGQTEPAEEEEKRAVLEEPAAVEDEDAGPSQQPSGLDGRWIGKLKELIDKIKEIIKKIKAAAENIQYTIRCFCDKMKSTSDNIQYYRGVMETETFRRSWMLCKRQVKALLKEMKPDKFEADLVIGAEDPAATGEILAICGMLYPLMGQNVRVLGDFERAHIEGYVYMKGRIHAFPFLCAAAKVYWNKDIRTLMKLFKKEAV